MGWLALLVVVAIVVLFVAGLKIVNEYQRIVVFRLGRCIGARGPGVQYIFPVLERGVWVDLRESFLQVPHQTCITKDNAPIAVDFLAYWKVVDPVRTVVEVANFQGASQGIATTTLRAVIGDILLDDVLSNREQINQVLRTKLDDVTERWGVKVTSVEIREINPPAEVQDAMNRVMSAEREKRAVVLESQGKKESAVLVANGARQAAILRAQGDRDAVRLRAEGTALALRSVYSAAQGIDDKTMSLQYLEALKALGASPTSRFIFPMEFSGLLRPFGEYTERALNGSPPSRDSRDSAPGTPRPPA
jgi:regulator of protease activity HflC (stomatin/prohibitin superfamily)